MKKVLVLEDEASIRSFIVINLRRGGYDVIEAESGEEALERLKEHPDTKVALLDIMLPGIDGFEVCRRIRATNSRIGIIMPVVVVLSVIGGYAANIRSFDITVMVVFGFLGYLFKKLHISPAPMALGIILGSLVELNYRRGLMAGNYSLAPFVTRPVAAVLALLLMFRMLAPSTPAIRLEKTWVTLNMAFRFTSTTFENMSEDMLNRVRPCSMEKSTISMVTCSILVQASAGAMPAPLMRMWY